MLAIHLTNSRRCEIGGGGGNSTLGGSYERTPVFGTGDFSNSSTPPGAGYPAKNLERRRGIEPRSPRLQLGRSPLAVAAPGTPGMIRTSKGGFGIRLPHHRHWGMWCARLDSNQHWGCPLGPFEAAASAGLDYGRISGRLSRIRTDTVHGLSVLPLPVGLRACGVRGEIRTRNNAALNRMRLPSCATRTLVGSQGFEPWMFPIGLPGLQPGAFSLSANCPNTNCQRSGGRQATRTPMSRGTLA